jgi:hypothetical protein
MFRGVQITRDSRNTNLYSDVFAEMSNIVSKHEPEKRNTHSGITNTLPLISVEQAMKELLEMENEINQKES